MSGANQSSPSSGMFTLRLQPADKLALQKFVEEGFGESMSEVARSILRAVLHGDDVLLFHLDLIRVELHLKRLCVQLREGEGRLEPTVLHQVLNAFEIILGKLNRFTGNRS